MTRTSPIVRVVSGALAGAALCVLPSRAAEIEMPNRKPGLWEINMVLAGGQIPPRTIQHCTDATTDKDMNTTFSPMTKEMCSKQDMQKTATGMVIDSTCNIAGIASTTHTEIVGDFNSAYTMKVTSSHPAAPGSAPKETNMTIEAKWMGACKPDQKPGDMIMPGGIKMNIKDMQALRNMIPGGAPKH
ncbi:MAG: DUF3617 domain-containing protein [Xanthobacteraceae bacterium]|nr:DUF3617 domain-containing protein [Xanthobacteraceae bacterium]